MTTRVKICGLKTEAALAAALEAGADMVGFVFFPASPRHVEIAQASALARCAAGKADVEALTVDADDALLDRIVAEVKPQWLQMHGRETPERVGAVRARFGVSVLKVIGVETAEDAARARAYRDVADLIMFDAKAPKGSVIPGGNGVTFDWRLLGGVMEQVPYMLSGGLTADNVGDAIHATGAGLVDVSSGVERSPGIKDPDKIRAFLQAVRSADQSSPRSAVSKRSV